MRLQAQYELELAELATAEQIQREVKVLAERRPGYRAG
jgi:hypothetical protein